MLAFVPPRPIVAAAERLIASGAIPGVSSWLLANGDLVPTRGRALDVACGRGRHALALASAGLAVRAIDRDLEALALVDAAALRLVLSVETSVVDLEQQAVLLGDADFDLVLVVHYLHRPLFPALTRALKPGGLLRYETFTTEQAPRGRPKNPAFLLESGELPRLVTPLTVLREREGEFEGRHVAAVVARR
jgi:SAM-dependent methyltransferase